MSIAAVKWMTQQKAGDATAKALLFWLAWHMNDETGLCYPSLATLTKEMEVTTNTVRTAVEKLVKARVITATAERSPGGKIVRTKYTLIGYRTAEKDGANIEPSKTEVSIIDVSNPDVSNIDISNSEGSLYQNLSGVVSNFDSNSKRERKEERKVGAQATASAPALMLEPPSKPTKKQPGGASRTMPLSEAVDELPAEWRRYAEKTRPEIDPDQMFASFCFHFTEGSGANKRRTVRGWGSSWQGWVRREKATEANRARPKEKTPEEHRAYQRDVAIAYGFPEQYADECVDNRYSTGSQSIEDAVLTTARPQ